MTNIQWTEKQIPFTKDIKWNAEVEGLIMEIHLHHYPRGLSMWSCRVWLHRNLSTAGEVKNSLPEAKREVIQLAKNMCTDYYESIKPIMREFGLID